MAALFSVCAFFYSGQEKPTWTKIKGLYNIEDEVKTLDIKYDRFTNNLLLSNSFYSIEQVIFTKQLTLSLEIILMRSLSHRAF